MLDIGVWNVFILRFESGVVARRAGAARRFQFNDQRGDLRLATVQVNVGGEDFEDYVETEGANVPIGAVIKTQGALEELDEILAISHL